MLALNDNVRRAVGGSQQPKVDPAISPGREPLQGHAKLLTEEVLAQDLEVVG